MVFLTVFSMKTPMLTLGAMALFLLLLLGNAWSQDDDSTMPTYEGNVVIISKNLMVTSTLGGKERTHPLTADTIVTLDGIVCQAQRLKAGTRIRVTLSSSDVTVATHIEAIDKNPGFVKKREDGKIVSITRSLVVISRANGRKDRSFLLDDSSLFTCDAIPCKWSDLKAGMRARVISEWGNAVEAFRVEALDKLHDFKIQTHDGKILRIFANHLIHIDNMSKALHSCKIAATVTVTCDGKPCTFADLRPGMSIRLTTVFEDRDAVIQIEALDKNPEFAKTKGK